MTNPTTEIPKLRELLGPHLGDNCAILSYSTSNLTAVGDNYGSTMLALTVKIRCPGKKLERTLHLVAKMVPRNEGLFQLFQVPISFPKESDMYTKVAAALDKHQVEYQVPSDMRMDTFCKFYGTRRNLNGSAVVDKDAVLVLENLKVRGFQCGDRRKGFNKQHTEYALRHLSRFHGVPIAIRYLKSEVFERDIVPALKKISVDEGVSIMEETVKLLTSTIQRIPEISGLLSRILKQFEAGMTLNRLKIMTRKSIYNSICHNDFWVNNMMLRRDEKGNPIEIKILDFQLVYFNSVALDVIFFLFTSVSNDVLEVNLDHFLRLYFDELSKCLGANGCPLEKFTFESFMEEVNDLAKFELSHILLMTKVIQMDNQKLGEDIEVTDDMLLNPNLIGPDYFEKIKLVVLMFQKRNWLMAE